MKIHVPVTCIAIAMGVATCFVLSNAEQSPNLDVATNLPLKMQPQATALLREFRSTQYFWKQAEVGQKLVELQDKSVVPAMLEMLDSPDRAERCNTGRVLAGLGDDRGLFAVIAELNDTAPRQAYNHGKRAEDVGKRSQMRQDRYYAAHVLGEIGDIRAVPALIECLEDETINYKAASVLGHLGDQRAVPALLTALERAQVAQKLHSTNRDMRFWAGYGLMGLRHPKGLPTVAQCLRPDRHFIQRRYAVDALGEFGDKEAIPFLIKALKDSDVEVRVNASMALGRIGDKAAIPALKAVVQDKSQAKGRTRIRYKPPMPFFKSMTVHEAAAYALNQIKNKKAIASTE